MHQPIQYLLVMSKIPSSQSGELPSPSAWCSWLYFFWHFLFFLVTITNAISNLPRFLFAIGILLLNLIAYLVVMDPIFIMRDRDVRDVLSGISWMPKCLKLSWNQLENHVSTYSCTTQHFLVYEGIVF